MRRRSRSIDAWAEASSLVDRVTIAFAASHGIGRAFAYDADLARAGLASVA